MTVKVMSTKFTRRRCNCNCNCSGGVFDFRRAFPDFLWDLLPQLITTINYVGGPRKYRETRKSRPRFHFIASRMCAPAQLKGSFLKKRSDSDLNRNNCVTLVQAGDKRRGPSSLRFRHYSSVITVPFPPPKPRKIR